MASSKGHNDLNQDADDFLSEFLHFVQQHKESAASHANGVSILSECNDLTKECKSQSNIRNATADNFLFDLEIPSVEVTLPEEDVSMINHELDKINCLPDVNTNDAVMGILSEPIISSFLCPTKATSSHTDISFGNDSRVDDDISKRVSAELEKVLGDPRAFEDIGLYLECSEDEIQSIQIDTAKKNKFGTGNFCLHAGNSNLQSDVSLKISFPTVLNADEDSKRCSSCKLSFVSAVELISHLDTSNCKVLICKECVYNTKSVKRFLTHMERRHNVLGLNMLQHDFNDQWSKHNVSRTNELETVCTEEKNTDTDKSGITCASTHVGDILEDLTEGGNRGLTFPCRFCDYSGKSARLLKMHHQNLHNLSRGLYGCKNCAFTCLQRRTLDTHSKTHEKTVLFDCPECKKRFLTSSALNRHSKTHRISRDFCCSMCDKAFKVKGTLTDHMKRVHKVEVSASSDHLNGSYQSVHMTHESGLSNDLTTTDTICIIAGNKEATSAREQVDIHSFTAEKSATLCQIQTGKTTNICVEEPFQTNKKAPNKRFSCTWPNCGKKFRDNFNLNNHFSRHTETKKICCSDCCFKCIQKGHLNYHVKTNHSKKEIAKN